MLTLVIGGAGSGKSALAESLVARLPAPRVYVATMRPVDSECEARIARHRRMRAGKSFETLERYADLAGAAPLLPGGANVLLECMSNLVANELYSPNGGGTKAVLAGVRALTQTCASLTIVTNEVFSGGADYAGDTLCYLRALARVNRALAADASLVVEAVCGVPNVLKGEWP